MELYKKFRCKDKNGNIFRAMLEEETAFIYGKGRKHYGWRITKEAFEQNYTILEKNEEQLEKSRQRKLDNIISKLEKSGLWQDLLPKFRNMKLYTLKERDKIEKLINLGDISYLAENVEPDLNYEHSFDGKKQEGVVLAYGRDRGETDIDAQIGSLKDMAGGWIEYIYVYSLDNKWLYADTYYKPLKLKDLKTKVDKIKEEE